MKLLFTGLLFAYGIGLQAQTTLHHVNEALALAEKNNPEYAAALARPELRKADKFMAESAMMPQITGFAAGDYNARLPVQPCTGRNFWRSSGHVQVNCASALPYNLNAGLDLSFPIIKANQWFEHTAAKAEWQRSESEAEQVAESIRLRTAQAYFSYIAATEAVQLNEKQLGPPRPR